MVIEVLVHPPAPILRREISEKRVRMPGALRFPALVKFAHAIPQTRLLLRKIPRVADHKHFLRRIPLAKWFLVRINGLYKATHDPANQHAGRIDFSGGHIHRGRAVRQHLADIHLPPLAWRSRLQAIDPTDDLIDRFPLEKILNNAPEFDSENDSTPCFMTVLITAAQVGVLSWIFILFSVNPDWQHHTDAP